MASRLNAAPRRTWTAPRARGGLARRGGSGRTWARQMPCARRTRGRREPALGDSGSTLVRAVAAEPAGAGVPVRPDSLLARGAPSGPMSRRRSSRPAATRPRPVVSPSPAPEICSRSRSAGQMLGQVEAPASATTDETCGTASSSPTDVGPIEGGPEPVSLDREPRQDAAGLRPVLGPRPAVAGSPTIDVTTAVHDTRTTCVRRSRGSSRLSRSSRRSCSSSAPSGRAPAWARVRDGISGQPRTHISWTPSWRSPRLRGGSGARRLGRRLGRRARADVRRFRRLLDVLQRIRGQPSRSTTGSSGSITGSLSARASSSCCDFPHSSLSR